VPKTAAGTRPERDSFDRGAAMTARDVDQRAFADATLVRVWSTEIDTNRAAEYDQFVSRKSIPMFQRQRGFVAALFCGRGRERAVITLWRDRAAVDALDTSETYRATVTEIEAAGFLQGEQTTEIFDLHSQAVRD
jgi:hypothetical protein